ncbi:uncharacterized protein LOC141693384 [Apium graveolens]|uniref:uncharacterized protein LOC141693384 n=1 Tax=Apium graveolens TaxID=4045 RepID=UPI003D7A819C
MPKKKPKQASLKTMANSSEKSEWAPTNILDPRDNGKQNWKDDRIAEAMTLFKDKFNLVLPSSDELADWYRDGWIYFYFYPFSIGLMLPYSDLIKGVITALHVSPGQLMPSNWRTLACLDAIETKHKLGINVDVVKYSYSLKKFSNCRFSLVNKDKNNPLILNNETVNDRGWKGEYFYAEKSTLGDDVDNLLEKWNVDGIKFEAKEDDVGARKITEKIMSLHVADRVWPNCLNRSIRNASAIDTSELTASMKKTASKGDVVPPSATTAAKGASSRT